MIDLKNTSSRQPNQAKHVVRANITILFALGLVAGMGLLIVLEWLGEIYGIDEFNADLLAIALTVSVMTALATVMRFGVFHSKARLASSEVSIWSLRRALAGKGPNRFEFVYQPKVDLVSGRIAGIEALARWRRADGVLTSIEPMIPLLEASGTIPRLTQLAARDAIKTLARLRPYQPDLWVSFNVSAQDLAGSRLLKDLEGLPQAHGVPTSSIMLEVTETSAMSQGEESRRALLGLRSAGFQVVMDDFGTGYSSLYELQRMPFNAVKIDRSFVLNLNESRTSRTLVQTMILLGHKLGMEVVAEGVEDAGVAQMLATFGADYGQGHFYAKPLGPAEITEKVKAHAKAHGKARKASALVSPQDLASLGRTEHSEAAVGKAARPIQPRFRQAVSSVVSRALPAGMRGDKHPTRLEEAGQS